MPRSRLREVYQSLNQPRLTRLLPVSFITWMTIFFHLGYAEIPFEGGIPVAEPAAFDTVAAGFLHDLDDHFL